MISFEYIEIKVVVIVNVKYRLTLGFRGITWNTFDGQLVPTDDTNRPPRVLYVTPQNPWVTV